MPYYRVLIFPLVLCWSLSLAQTQTDSLIHSGFHINRGKALYDSGLYDQAVREFQYIDPRDTNYISSLTELASTYYSNKQYDEAIATSAKALLQPSPFRSQLLTTQGMAYVEKGQYDKAQSIFEIGMKEFPFYPSFPNQYGKMLYAQKKYEEAEKYFFQAISTSPFNLISHLYLGIISMQRGEKTRGMMAMGIYMALNNTANNHLVTLERFVKNELTDEFSVPPSIPNPFARLDEIIRSKIAMDDRYKTKIPINIGIVKQYQLLFEQIATQEFAGNDPWVSIYIPIYQSLIKGNDQEAFVYHILKSTSIKSVPEWTKKNEKALEQFYTVMNTAIPLVRAKKTLSEWGYREPVSCWYSNGNRLTSIGQKNNKNENIGLWYFFNDNGCLKAKGTYDDHGHKTALWNYYNSSGTQSDIENFDTGERIHFNEQGILKQKYVIKNDKVDGELFNYFDCGTVREHIRYRNGNREGSGEIYSIQGTVVEKFTYVNDSLQGKYQSYYATGEIQQESTYEHGKLNKTFTRYHKNGKIASKGEYVMGAGVGLWKIYHDNGKLKEVGEYKADLPFGKFTFYDRYGRVKEIRNYNEKGEYDGEDLFMHNGTPHYQLIFRANMIIGLTYYDRKGNVLANYADATGSLRCKGYFPTGEIRSEFQYVNGKATGTWKYYYRTGNLESIYEYKDDALNGKAIDYYADKTIKSISYYKNGELHGYYEGFNENGQPRTRGWYQDGQLQQGWISYHTNGKIKTDEYYLNNALTGSSSYYDPDGKIVTTTEYLAGRTLGIQYYNQKGVPNSVATSSDGGHIKISSQFKSGKEALRTELLCGYYNGYVNTYLPDGKNFLIREFENDHRDGDYKKYFPDGKLECSGNYSNGNCTGPMTWYYPNQTRETFGIYVDDERDSLWTYYFENGKPSHIIAYQDGKKHGLTKLFGPEGQLIIEKLYDEGDLIAYRDPGQKDTVWTSFKGNGTIRSHYPGGKIAVEETYANGQLEGSRKIYLPSGALLNLDNYVKGLSEGIAIDNSLNGKVRIKKNYKMDEPTGRWEYYNENGTLERVENYSFGQLHGPTEFFSNGKKIREVKFWHGLPTD